MKLLKKIAIIATICGISGVTWQLLERERIIWSTVGVCLRDNLRKEKKVYLDEVNHIHGVFVVNTSYQGGDKIKIIISGHTFFHGLCDVTFKDNRVDKLEIGYLD